MPKKTQYLNAQAELLFMKHRTVDPKSALLWIRFYNYAVSRSPPSYTALSIQLNFLTSVSWVKTNGSDHSICF